MFTIKNINPGIYFLTLIFPISMVAGPAVYEINAILLILSYFVLAKDKFEIFEDFKKFKFFFYFYLYLVFISFFSVVIEESLKETLTFIRFILFSIALLFFLKNIPDIITQTYKVLICIVVLFFIDSLIQFYFGVNIIGIKKQNPFRVSSFFSDELIMGGFFYRLFPIFIAIHFFVKKKFDKFFFIYLFVFEVIIFLSGERTALILYNFYLFLMFIIFVELRKKIIFTFIGLITFLAFFLLFNKNYQQRYLIDTFQGLTHQQKEITLHKMHLFSNEHESQYRTAINIFKKNIIVGTGPKSFRVECKKPEYRIDNVSCSTHPHNFYIELLTETGVMGFVFLSSFYIVIIFKIVKNLKSNNYEYIMLLLALLIMFFPLSPSGSFFNNFLSFFHFMALSFLFFFEKQSK